MRCINFTGSDTTARILAAQAGRTLKRMVLELSPLINDRAVEQIAGRVKDALDRGATLVTGGTVDGRLYSPTILTDVPPDAVCTTGCDESVGPLLIVQAFDDAEAALAEAQDTPHGLSAAIMTKDRFRGLDMAQRLDAGIVHVNAPTMASEAALPVGGVKDSGGGRSGPYAIDDFTELRLTTVSGLPGRYPF